MTWLIIANDASSAVAVVLCWWLAHVSAGSRGRLGKWAACGYAVVASLVAIPAFDRSASADADMLGLLVASKIAVASVFAAIAVPGWPVEGTEPAAFKGMPAVRPRSPCGGRRERAADACSRRSQPDRSE